MWILSQKQAVNFAVLANVYLLMAVASFFNLSAELMKNLWKKFEPILGGYNVLKKCPPW
jgi:hypothetical protein